MEEMTKEEPSHNSPSFEYQYKAVPRIMYNTKYFDSTSYFQVLNVRLVNVLVRQKERSQYNYFMFINMLLMCLEIIIVPQFFLT